MAKPRVLICAQTFASFVTEQYGGHAERIWQGTKDPAELKSAIQALQADLASPAVTHLLGELQLCVQPC